MPDKGGSQVRAQGGTPPRKFRGGAWWMGRVPKGADLLGFLDAFVREKGIRAGVVGVIGVVARARVGFFDAETGQYVVTEADGHREIAACSGNVSLRDGRPAVHAHVVLSDDKGRATAGHLLEGTETHYAEFWVAALEGRAFERGPDPETKVTGWVR